MDDTPKVKKAAARRKSKAKTEMDGKEASAKKTPKPRKQSVGSAKKGESTY